MKLVRPVIVVASVALAIAVPLGAGAAATSSGVHPTTAEITGSVVDSGSHPLTGICISVLDSSGNSTSFGQTTASGTYDLTGITPGTYTATYQDCNRSTGPNVQPQYYDNTQVYASRHLLTLAAGQTRALDTQTMRVGAQVSLHLSDSHGNPVSGIEVQMETPSGPTFLPNFDSLALSNATGDITFVGLYQLPYTLEYESCPHIWCAVVGYYPNDPSNRPSTVQPVVGTPTNLTDTLDVPTVEISTTSVTASPTSAVVGQPVTLSATVADSDGSIPDGYVAFTIGTTNLGSAWVGASSGTANLTTTALPLGASDVFATFEADEIAVTSSFAAVTVTVSAVSSGGGGASGGSSGGSNSSGGGGGGSTAPVITGAPVTRLAGTDRIATAVAVSQNSFPAGNAAAVVLARADDYPDALVGGPLAAAKNAPLLLTQGSTLPAETAAEVKRVLPAGGTVYLLGGTTAIPTGVTSQLTSMGYTVTRYSGADRYATAVAVATALGSPTTVLLATGTNYPDALAAGPAAAHVHGAILLTDGSSVPTETATYLAGAHVTYAIGGPAAAAVPSATAIVGGDRYATAAAVATKFFPTSAVVGVATGTGFPDALAGGAQLALMGGPLLLSSMGSVPTSTSNYLAADHSALTKVYVYGGTSVLSANVVTELTAALGG